MNTNSDNKIKYFLYARKSEESEDRQVQSIPDQLNRLKVLAQQLGLEIVEILSEAKSAKKPFNRPVFTDMMARIENGQARGILCWQINRLSRNPIDSGTLSWLLQQGVLQCIQTIDRRYLPDDNVLLFNVESSMANQFIIDLRKNCKRGLEGKAERGWRPGLPPIGYLNEKGSRIIIKDEARFDLVRRMWDMLLSGNYPVRTIREIANNEWGLKTTGHKILGKKPVSHALMYKIFTSIFYTGMFEYGGKLYPGKHTPMITMEEFRRVQVLLGRKGTSKYQKHQFAYSGLIRCGGCGAMITASVKTKFVKATTQFQSYVYYHCTRKKKNAKCTEKPLTVLNLDSQIEGILDRFTIRPEFFGWAMEALQIERTKSYEDQKRIYEARQETLVAAQKELQNLTRMRYKDLIDDETYIRERNTLQCEIFKFQEQFNETEQHPEKHIELTEKTFHFATYARCAFLGGDIQQKREILSTIGSNCQIKDKRISIEAFEWLKPIEKYYPLLEAEFERFEPKKNYNSIGRISHLDTLCQGLRATVDDVRTVFLQNKDQSIHIPTLPYPRNPQPP